MNANIDVLDDKTHEDLQVDFKEARKSAYKQRLIPVVVSEFHSLMFHYPIVFVKDGETGAFTCSLLLGVSGEASLLEDQDITNDEVLPLNVRRLPLVAIESSDDSGPVIGVNLDSPGVGKGEKLFASQSSGLESAVAALGELYRGYKDTDAFIKTALELGLITTLKAEIQFNGKPRIALEGLYGIDTNKVPQITDSADKDKFLTIANFAYAQSFSLYNMRKLTFLTA
ncbi:SapC family protein [Cellvibrio sp. ARAG 10.3]|uniref:SapC family protein n=1 Tax=Cellvibrio sp. ARAG 10.3 TaxID=3451358 RepID=UPI003F46F956